MLEAEREARLFTEVDGIAAHAGRCESVAQVGQMERQRRCADGRFGFGEAQQEPIRGAAAQEVEDFPGSANAASV